MEPATTGMMIAAMPKIVEMVKGFIMKVEENVLGVLAVVCLERLQ